MLRKYISVKWLKEKNKHISGVGGGEGDLKIVGGCTNYKGDCSSIWSDSKGSQST